MFTDTDEARTTFDDLIRSCVEKTKGRHDGDGCYGTSSLTSPNLDELKWVKDGLYRAARRAKYSLKASIHRQPDTKRDDHHLYTTTIYRLDFTVINKEHGERYIREKHGGIIPGYPSWPKK